jgi:hypothetical protein
LALYNSIVNIEYSLREEFRNSDVQARIPLHLEARGRDIVVLGESAPSKFYSFTATVTPVVNRLSREEKKDLIQRGYIKLDEFNNPIGKLYSLQNLTGSNILVGNFVRQMYLNFQEGPGVDLIENNFNYDITEEVEEFV